MTTLLRAGLATAALLALGGCAYAPLKAPCAPDEDAAALSYSDPPRTSLSLPLTFPLRNACGPMRPIRGVDGQ
jgi:hypothetical protein